MARWFFSCLGVMALGTVGGPKVCARTFPESAGLRDSAMDFRIGTEEMQRQTRTHTAETLRACHPPHFGPS